MSTAKEEKKLSSLERFHSDKQIGKHRCSLSWYCWEVFLACRNTAFLCRSGFLYGYKVGTKTAANFHTQTRLVSPSLNRGEKSRHITRHIDIQRCLTDSSYLSESRFGDRLRCVTRLPRVVHFLRKLKGAGTENSIATHTLSAAATCRT